MHTVFAYRNLTKSKWSLRATAGDRRGIVVDRVDAVLLADCTLKVSEAGRQRVIRERRKNVHAGIIGTPCKMAPDDPRIDSRRAVRIKYNPYVGPEFRREDNGAPVATADLVLLDYAGRAFIFVPSGRV